jgi:uncharacterized integral membrane protein
LAILVAIMVVQNQKPVTTHLVSSVVIPHVVLLFITAAAGFALGALLRLNTRRKQIPSGEG